MQVSIKRAYDPPQPEDGFRVLVDRLWPRGLSKERIKADLWFKNIAPSAELRKWFHHEQSNWPEFKKRYLAELKGAASVVEEFKKALAGHRKITLLYGAKDEQHNQAVVLREFLSKG